METYLAIASLRTIRAYMREAVPPEKVERILEAGRVTGSAYNAQPWTFLVLQTQELIRSIATCVNRPSNLAEAPLGIAIVLSEDTPLTRFDAGRCAQNMMLTGWSEGIGSAPNHVRDPDKFWQLVDLHEAPIATVLSFGVLEPGVEPTKRSPEKWVDRAARKSMDEVAHFM